MDLFERVIYNKDRSEITPKIKIKGVQKMKKAEKYNLEIKMEEVRSECLRLQNVISEIAKSNGIDGDGYLATVIIEAMEKAGKFELISAYAFSYYYQLGMFEVYNCILRKV